MRVGVDPQGCEGARDDDPAQFAEQISRVPLTRLGEPDDVAAVVRFLASEARGVGRERSIRLLRSETPARTFVPDICARYIIDIARFFERR